MIYPPGHLYLNDSSEEDWGSPQEATPKVEAPAAPPESIATVTLTDQVRRCYICALNATKLLLPASKAPCCSECLLKYIPLGFDPNTPIKLKK
jgi:hypothetical protein